MGKSTIIARYCNSEYTDVSNTTTHIDFRVKTLEVNKEVVKI